MIIQVTAKHIKRGKRGECMKCPISLAITEALKPCKAMVTYENLRIGTALPLKQVMRTPMDLQLFMYCFDRGDDVEPFEFELEGF